MKHYVFFLPGEYEDSGFLFTILFVISGQIFFFSFCDQIL